LLAVIEQADWIIDDGSVRAGPAGCLAAVRVLVRLQLAARGRRSRIELVRVGDELRGMLADFGFTEILPEHDPQP
jgi:hypothetical protein